MSDTTDTVVDLIDRQEQIFRARLAGKSVRALLMKQPQKTFGKRQQT